MRHRISLLFLLAFIICGLSYASLSAQTGTYYNQRDDEYRVLGLKRSKQAYETARKEYERLKEMYDKNLLTEVELEKAYNNMTDAEVNYQQSLLAVLFEQQYVSVEKAVKYQADDGTKHVRLTLANMSGGSAEFRKLVNLEDELFRSLQPDIINNVYVSILNDDNAIISQPYEAKIDQLVYGKPCELDFTLLEDLDAVTVDMIYSNGTQRNMKIFLQKDNSVNKVVVQSEQFSQEVELGKTASYDLTLELFSGTSNTFSLMAVNLPAEITRYFRDPGGQVRLRQVKFTETSRSKRAALDITLPDRPTDAVLMDKPIPFYVLVLPRERAEEISDLDTKSWTQADLEKLDIGFVKLELVPRGKGELLVRAPQLFHSIKASENAQMYVDLKNEGSHRLDNIETEVDLPFGWTKEIDKSVIQSLDINEDSRVTMKFKPPENISAGKYEIRIRTTAMSSSQPIHGEDKTVTVEIRSGTNVIGTLVIVLLILGLVGGIVAYGIKLSRR